MSAFNPNNGLLNLQTYCYTAEFTDTAWAWEFLRRNPHYCADANLKKANAADWSLLRFEDPQLDARHADVFWTPEVCKHVLPLTMGAKQESGQRVSLEKLKCRVVVHDADETRHILFAEAGRALQIQITGTGPCENAALLTPALAPPQLRTARLFAIRRFSDLMAHGCLRPSLYPPENRAKRLAQILLALDAALAGRQHRDIAVALFGEGRVDRDWHHPHNYLRDHVRRAIIYGRELMEGGYRKFLQ